MIGGIGGTDIAAFAASSAITRNAKAAAPASDLTATTSGSDAKTVFKNYMKMTPAERMEENWLKAHGLSREKLAAMSPEDREAVMKQMKEDIERAAKEKAEKGAMVDITA